MVEKRFETIESKKCCSDMKKEDIKCVDECKEAAVELGLTFGGPWNQTPNTQNISKSCFTIDGIVVWRKYGEAEISKWSHAICRKTGKYILQYAFASN